MEHKIAFNTHSKWKENNKKRARAIVRKSARTPIFVAKCAAQSAPFLPPNVHHIWNPFRSTEFFKTITFLSRPTTLPGSKLHGNQIFKSVRATLACRTIMLQIVSTFGAQNASKCAFKMETNLSKMRTSFFYATLRVRQMCYTFGTVFASKCAAHLERFSAYRILQNGHFPYQTDDGSRMQITWKPDF